MDVSVLRARGHHLCEESRRLLRWSRALLDHPFRPIRGASGTTGSVPIILARLRRMIAERRLPRKPPAVWAYRSPGRRACVACESAIQPGEVEYEVTVGDEVTAMHQGCAELWAHVGGLYP